MKSQEILWITLCSSAVSTVFSHFVGSSVISPAVDICYDRFIISTDINELLIINHCRSQFLIDCSVGGSVVVHVSASPSLVSDSDVTSHVTELQVGRAAALRADISQQEPHPFKAPSSLISWVFVRTVKSRSARQQRGTKSRLKGTLRCFQLHLMVFIHK